MIKAGIIGSTGYAGQELVRLLLAHPEVEIVWYGSRSYVDQNYSDVYGNMFKLVDAKCLDDDLGRLSEEADVIFTATPQGLCASMVNEKILTHSRIIDLSADFRLKSVDVYEKSTKYSRTEGNPVMIYYKYQLTPQENTKILFGEGFPTPEERESSKADDLSISA